MSTSTLFKIPFSFAPLDADGNAVTDPAALTQISWSASDPAVAQAVVNATDSTKAELVPIGPGKVTLTLSAVNSIGEKLEETADVEFSTPIPVVKSLNLKAGDPVAAIA